MSGLPGSGKTTLGRGIAAALGVPLLEYAHLPLVTTATGEKLSKQTRAAAVDPAGGSAVLAEAMRFLGHAVPEEISRGSLRDFWRWAIANWSIERIPVRRSASLARTS